MKKREKRIWKVLRNIGIVVIILVVICVGYVSKYYHTEPAVLEQMSSLDFGPEMNYSIVDVKNDRIAFVPEEPVAGLIFYPGGKVQYESYIPLMEQCAQRGILCVLMHMPGNLAVLDMNAAEGIQAQYPQVEHWYMGGHSLGGSMAASYLGKHITDFDGLILLAAYSTVDMSKSELRGLSLYGSEDGVLGMETYEEKKSNLPGDTIEVVIQGGCHAQFGSYGPQKGDGVPSISAEEQQTQTAEAIEAWIKE